MNPKEFSLLSTLRSALRRPARRAASCLLPGLERLERRLALTTYTWSALGDGTTWNDPNNWTHYNPNLRAQEPGTPTAYSDVVFPPQAILPKGSSATINFNFTFLNMPLDSLTINDSYTFTGTPVTIEQSLSLNNPFTSARNGAVADLELSGMNLAPGATIYTQTGSMLQLGTTASPTGFLLGLQGAMTKTGGGQLLVDTSSISFPTTALRLPVPVSVAGGSMTLGENVTVERRQLRCLTEREPDRCRRRRRGCSLYYWNRVREPRRNDRSRRHDEPDHPRSHCKHRRLRRPDRRHRPVHHGRIRQPHHRVNQFSRCRGDHRCAGLVAGEWHHQRRLAPGQFHRNIRRIGNVGVFRARWFFNRARLSWSR